MSTFSVVSIPHFQQNRTAIPRASTLLPPWSTTKTKQNVLFTKYMRKTSLLWQKELWIVIIKNFNRSTSLWIFSHWNHHKKEYKSWSRKCLKGSFVFIELYHMSEKKRQTGAKMYVRCLDSKLWPVSVLNLYLCFH